MAYVMSATAINMKRPKTRLRTLFKFLTDTISSYIDSFNSSVISSMEGNLGIKAYYSEDTDLYKTFYPQFRRTFRIENPEEDNFQPSINSLRAYDSIGTIKQAMERFRSKENNPNALLKNILSSNFTVLSGEIRFDERKLSHDPILRIVNVVLLVVTWPGNSNLVPKGWAMPTSMNQMIIGVPARTSFEKFVKVEDGKYSGMKNYGGFCIELFYKVLSVLDYALPFQFDPHDGTYDELVHKVYNKTYDAAVGDITILARTDYVEITQPYAVSGLSMIVPVKPEDSAWMFLKPFTTEMWLVTGAILMYTMFIVWFLEHQSNPEFKGPWNNQIGTALWFTFSYLFFGHRERLYSNLNRVVVVVWLFVVLILNSSYTASLTSMLTMQRLEPNVTDIEWLKRANVKIGCDGENNVGDLSPVDDSAWIKAFRVAKYLCNGEVCVQGELSAAPQAPDTDEWSSSRRDYDQAPVPINMENLEVTSAEKEMQLLIQTN
ncbi:Apoptosis inhibitory protein 5 isoform 1 [Hibiscus syriacus]|uniref:Apoptosis inhibitory protein 5 isoform 1 n=1 Tax=Hibiscus syriacus TaxID=106335 RepID=A0A6A3BU28_HIBSY|nr:Apoptosis inhibitory protein 5 isoform 1 [Hibiscus syriacus]